MKRTQVLPIALSTVFALSAGACSAPGSATDLSAGIKPRPVASAPVNANFTNAVASFSVGLFQQVATGQDNYLVSPLSAELALAMAANGAGSATLDQMQQTLAPGLTIDQINAILPAWAYGLPTSDGAKVYVANSVWCNKDSNIDIKQDFLQANADYYRAGTYSGPFDAGGVKDINAWVDKNTDGMIPSMVDKLDPTTAIVLLNALAFDAKWAAPYKEPDIMSGTFTNAAGQPETVDFMSSTEMTYLDDGLARGFTKPYDSGQYDFVALLPDEGVTMADYLASLSGDGWVETLTRTENAVVETKLPQFSFDYSTSLVDSLKALGMTDAFGPAADFAKMGTGHAGPLENGLFLSDVRQKTFIDVTPVGTRAGAATAVYGAGAAPPGPVEITLDRPFVFAIVDSATKLPLFMGVLNSVAP